MSYKIVKLDARYRYHQTWQYMVRWHGGPWTHSQRDQWLEMLHWCHTTWGWTVPAATSSKVLGNGDYSSWANRGWVNVKWSYEEPSDVRRIQYRIYLRSGEELAWLRLAHPVDQK